MVYNITQRKNYYEQQHIRGKNYYEQQHND